ncbi:general secretion pathway protein GspB [Ramlibacter sp.]|uniref:general secretion pathway protein GspB n=1 Tax=Ramlibacter sp. TaxID=1917967 RepID=UPI003D11A651
MSYILDALRKADAQRVRDPAHGIHAQPQVAASTREGRDWKQPAAVAALAAAVLLVAIALWPRTPAVPSSGGPSAATSDVPRAPAPGALAPGISSAPAVATPGAQVRAPVPTTANAAPRVAAPVAPPPPAARAERAVRNPANPQVAAATLPSPSPSPSPSPVVGMPAPAPAVPPPAPLPNAAPVAPAPSTPAVASAPPAGRAPAAVLTASAPSGRDRVMTVAELPFQLQRELPRLAISGGVYSDNPSQRMLIVGGQVANEGTELAPGLVLDQIRPNAAVMKFRGYRYSVPF